MTPRILTLLLAFFMVPPCHGEEFFTLDLMMLTYHAPIIFTAVPLQEKEFYTWTIPEKNYPYPSKQITRRFLVQKRIKTGSYPIPDTIQVCGWENHEGLGQGRWSNYDTVSYEYTTYTVDSFEVFVFFGSYHVKDTHYPPNTFHPILSGIRPFFRDTMYLPIQHSSPGPYSFDERDTISLSDFVQKTYRAMARLDSLLNLRGIKPATAQNQALFDWIEKHLEDLKTSNYFFFGKTGDRENNWGLIQWEVFNWIDKNDIWQDIWKGMEISMKVSKDSSPHCYSPNHGSGFAFANPEARAFLLKQVRDTTLDKGISGCAWGILCGSLWKKRGRGENLMLNVEAEERREIIKTALMVLDNKEQYSTQGALHTIDEVALPKYKELDDFYDEPTLAKLKGVLESEKESYTKSFLKSLIDRMQQAKK